MIIIDPQSTRRYVLKAERSLPQEQQSVFLLRPLTLSETAKLEDSVASVSTSKQISVLSGSSKLMALRMGLVGWENVRDSRGNEVPIKGTSKKQNGKDVFQVDNSSLEQLPSSVRFELSEEITNENGLSDDEAGNS